MVNDINEIDKTATALENFTCASQKSIVIEKNKQQYQSLNNTVMLRYWIYIEDKQKIYILFEYTGNIYKNRVQIRL